TSMRRARSSAGETTSITRPGSRTAAPDCTSSAFERADAAPGTRSFIDEVQRDSAPVATRPVPAWRLAKPSLERLAKVGRVAEPQNLRDFTHTEFPGIQQLAGPYLP